MARGSAKVCGLLEFGWTTRETNEIVTNTNFCGLRIFVEFRFNIKTRLFNQNSSGEFKFNVECSEMGPGCKTFHFYLDKKQFIVKIPRFKL